jgi:hypothetical protein
MEAIHDRMRVDKIAPSQPSDDSTSGPYSGLPVEVFTKGFFLGCFGMFVIFIIVIWPLRECVTARSGRRDHSHQQRE